MSIVPPCTKGPGGVPCGNARKGKYTPDQCPQCNINIHTRDELFRMLESEDAAPVRSLADTECDHVGEWAPPPPGSDVRKRYHRCKVGKGVGGVVSRCQCNSKCDGYSRIPDDASAEIAPPIGRRHLAMHVYPAAGNNSWRRALDQIAVRLDLFTGNRAIAVCTGPGLDPFDAVKDYAAGMDADVFAVKNDAARREVVSWRPLWDRVLKCNRSGDVAFYCHAKGTTRPVDAGNMTHVWASMLYSACLDYWPVVEDLLRTFPTAGCFKKLGYGFGRGYGRWHYSGTFYWVRTDDFFHRRYATPPPEHWWGTEAWPGIAYDAGEAGLIFKSGPVSKVDAYCPERWKNEYEPEFRSWAMANESKRIRSPTDTGFSPGQSRPSDSTTSQRTTVEFGRRRTITTVRTVSAQCAISPEFLRTVGASSPDGTGPG